MNAARIQAPPGFKTPDRAPINEAALDTGLTANQTEWLRSHMDIKLLVRTIAALSNPTHQNITENRPILERAIDG